MRRYTTILLLFLTIQSITSQTLTLDSCLSLARRNNPELRRQQLDIEKAKQVKQQAFTKYFPQVQASGFAFHSLYPMIDIGIDDIKNEELRQTLNLIYELVGADAGIEKNVTYLNYGVSAGVTALQPIFLGGRIIYGNKLAKVGVEAAQAQSEIKERDILQQVEEAYWLIVSLQHKQETLTTAFQMLDTVQHNLDIALTAGLALKSDQLKLQLRRNELEDKSLQLSNGIYLARMALANAIGLDDVDVVTDMPQTGETMLTDNAQSTIHRKESDLLDLQVKASEIEKKIEIGKALPQIGFGAAYSFSNLLNKNAHNGTLLVTVSVPLSQWWETSHRISEKNIAIEQAQLEQAYINKQLRLQNEQWQRQLEEASDRLQRSHDLLDAAEENMRLTRLNYNAGIATMSELLEAQAMLMQTQNDITDMQIGYIIAKKRITNNQ